MLAGKPDYLQKLKVPEGYEKINDSAESKPNFASKYALESSRQDLHNALLCTALQSQFFVKVCLLFWKIENSANLQRRHDTVTWAEKGRRFGKSIPRLKNTFGGSFSVVSKPIFR